MANELIINITSQETRVALLENGNLVEIYVESLKDRGIVGNIYKGKVVRVLPGIQAAFVDIGLEKASFLYVTDVEGNFEDLEAMLKGREEENGKLEFEDEDLREHPVHIEDLLKERQEVLVQVSKEPLGTKGARVTSHISIPGRHLVFMPTVNYVGVSRKIGNEKERKRLKEIIQRIKPDGVGFIVRTASERESEEGLKLDMEFLLRLWEYTMKKRGNAPVPSLIYQDLDVTLRIIRDFFTSDIDKLVVDSEKEYRKILNFMDSFMPSLKDKVELYREKEPIFEAYSIEADINKALGRKVWLRSGGYIVIEQTEALTAIDVNTGKYVGKKDLEETILKTNLDAAKEICHQLRLRNIGGIIIIDFIGMEKDAHREKVFRTLAERLRRDKTKTNVLRISELGLVEMTRKRTRESLTRTLCEPCSYCDGRGYLKSKSTICYELLRAVKKEASLTWGNIIVNVHPDIADILYNEEKSGIEEIERSFSKRIIIKADGRYHQEKYDIYEV